MTSHSRRALWFNNIAHSYNHMIMLLYPTAVLGMARDFGMPFGDLIGLASWGLALYGVAALPAGWLGDRWSESGMMAICFFGSGVGAVWVGMAEGPTGVMIGLTLLGLFAAIYHPVGISWLVGTADNPGKALGINGIFGSIGVAAGPLIAGALTDLASWRWAFLVPGALCLGTGVAFMVMVKGGLATAKTAGGARPMSETDARTVRALTALALTVLCTGFVYSAASVSLPKLFSERLAGTVDDTIWIGALVSTVYVLTAFTQILGGHLADRYDQKWAYAACQAVMVPMVLATAYVAGLPVVLAALLMLGCNVAGTPVENALIARFAPERWRAVVYGSKFVLTLGVSGLMVPPVVGFIDRTYGSIEWLYYLIAAAALGATVIAAFLLPGAPPNPRPMPVTQPAE